MNIDRQAAHYYDTGNKEELLNLANRVWSQAEEGDFPNGSADVFYFARTIEWRKEDKDPVQKELWHARALAAATLTGANHTAARLLMQSFFILMEHEAYAEARSVLGDMLRVVGPDHEQRPVFMRFHEEKSAYSFLAEGHYGDAVARYESAQDFCHDDPRGLLKVRGGLVLCQYLERTRPEREQVELVDSMRRIREESQSAGFVDVANDASCNLRMMEAGGYEGWCPFELL